MCLSLISRNCMSIIRRKHWPIWKLVMAEQLLSSAKQGNAIPGPPIHLNELNYIRYVLLRAIYV